MGIAPTLTAGGKIIRWHPRHDHGLPLLIQFKKMLLCPDIHTVIGNKNRQVTEHQHPALIGVLFQRRPLAKKEILLKADLVDGDLQTGPRLL